MIKKNKQLTILCIVLTIIIVLLISYIIVLKTPVTEAKPAPTKENKEKVEEKAFDLDKAELLLEEFGFNRRTGCKTVLQTEYNDNFKGIVVLEKLLKEKSTLQKCSNLFTEDSLVETPEVMYKSTLGVCFKDNSINTITYEDANQIYKKMYGEDMPTLHVNGLKNNNMDYILFEYLEDKNIFANLKFYGVGGSCMSSHIRSIRSATQKGNIIKINVYDYESGYTEIKDNIFTLTTDKFTTEISCSTFDECKNIIRNKYIHYLDEYEITFELIDNQYIFKSVNKII